MHHNTHILLISKVKTANLQVSYSNGDWPYTFEASSIPFKFAIELGEKVMSDVKAVFDTASELGEDELPYTKEDLNSDSCSESFSIEDYFKKATSLIKVCTNYSFQLT